MLVRLSCPPLMAQVLPAGTTLEVRLSKPTGSSISHSGDLVKGTIIAPISVAGQVVVPQGSRLIGSIESVKRFGLGLKQVTAAIDYRFHTLQFLNGEAIPIQTELLEVETAKERVDVDGTVRGIHPAVSLSSSLALFTVPLLFVAPTIGVPVWGIKSMIAPSASPEIYFPSGTELILRLTAPLEVRPSARRPAGVASFRPDEVDEAQEREEECAAGEDPVEERARQGDGRSRHGRPPLPRRLPRPGQCDGPGGPGATRRLPKLTWVTRLCCSTR